MDITIWHVIFGVIFVILFQKYIRGKNLTEGFVTYQQYYCNDCYRGGFMDESTCVKCTNCAWVISNGIGQCVPRTYSTPYYSYLFDTYYDNDLWGYNYPYYNNYYYNNYTPFYSLGSYYRPYYNRWRTSGRWGRDGRRVSTGRRGSSGSTGYRSSSRSNGDHDKR